VDSRPVSGLGPLHGLALAALSTLLIAVGHLAGGGAAVDLTVLVLLFPLLGGAVVAVAERCRTFVPTVATLAAGQVVLHVLIDVLHSHPPAPGAGLDGPTMLQMHVVATLVIAALLRHADGALAALRAALHHVLPRRLAVPPADAPLAALRVAGPAVPPRLAPVLAGVALRRGPPVGCRLPESLPSPVHLTSASADGPTGDLPCPRPSVAAARCASAPS
jgi:hypothetical protein